MVYSVALYAASHAPFAPSVVPITYPMSQGSVGQRFSLLLALHPHFELVAVGASERSKDKKYRDATAWKQTLPMPEKIGEIVVTACEPENFRNCDIVFSGLDSSVAGEVGR